MAEPHPIVAELLEKHKIIVVTTASPNWNEIRATYQNGNPAKPLGIARPKSAEEVSTIVKTARRHGIKVTVRGGGHDVATRCFADGCLAIDVREIKSIEISADETTATVGGGILIEDVIKTLSDRKLVTPFGYMPGVGYAGWAMMGGYGWLAPSLGLGVDQILRARVVTAQGDIIEADGELLKGIRGAGGNFGVIVELGIKIYPLEKFLAGLIIFQPSDMKASVNKYFAAYNSMEKSPYGVTEALWVPNPGDPSQWMFAVNFGWSSPDMDAGREYLQKILDLTGDKADISTIRERTSYEVAHFVEEGGHSMTVWGHQAGNGIDFEVVTPKTSQVVGDFVTKPAARGNLVLFHEVRGQSTEPHPDSCFGGRVAHTVMEIIGLTEDPNDAESSTKRYQEFRRALKGTGDAMDVTYASLTQTEDTDIQALFGKDYQFVMDLKDKYDPDGFFDNTEPRLRP